MGAVVEGAEAGVQLPGAVLELGQAAVELGVDAVVPWEAERSIVRWKGPKAAKARQKWADTARAAAKQAYSMSAVDEYGKVIDDIYDFAEAQGFEIDGILQEGGAGQVEINLNHGDPVALADEIFYFKRLIREAALRHDCFATFMAKPIEGEPGSAMHIHHSVVDAQTGQNIFSDEKGRETPEFLHFIAGMQKHLPAAVALLAPYVNSYKRFCAGLFAPTKAVWSCDNRTAAFRVCGEGTGAVRVECRIPGADANPYLVLAATLLCGYMGMVGGVKPGAPVKGRGYERRNLRLPVTIESALERMEACKDAEKFLGEKFIRGYVAVKRAEHENFKRVISSWEREFLLLSV